MCLTTSSSLNGGRRMAGGLGVNERSRCGGGAGLVGMGEGGGTNVGETQWSPWFPLPPGMNSVGTFL